MDRIIRVLVVDDSAYMRRVAKEMLERSPYIQVVGTARDGEEALEQVALLNPDVVTLDLIMPRMDGVTFIAKQMARHPVRILVVSIASESGELALNALDAGAVDFVQKPTALATERIFEMGDELVMRVKAAASAQPLRRTPPPDTNHSEGRSATPVILARTKVDIVVVGISTGGPQALKQVIPALPADFPVPIAIVIHMPVGYTELYAHTLNEISRLKVREAQEGDPIAPGTVLLAPAGRHMTFRPGGNGLVVAHFDSRPANTLHRPSVDVMFQSAAETYGSRVLAVVMTGMGEDGKQGAAWVKSQGGTVLTEAESTCVVYGMPRSVDEAGLSDASIPLDQMPSTIANLVVGMENR